MMQPGIVAAQSQPPAASGLVKDGTPTDDAVPWGFTAPEAHGAAGDGATDDTSALNTTFSQSAPVWMPNKPYRITDTVSIPSSCPGVWCWGGRALFNREHDRPAIEVGSQTTSVDFIDLFGLQTIAQSQSDWSNEASVGVRCWNSRSWFLYLPRVRGFTLGIQCRPESDGSNRAWAYGIGRLGALENCKIGLELDATSNRGWTNENIWFGGRIRVETGVNPSADRLGLRCHSSTGNYPQANNNSFIGPIFELDAAAAAGNAVCIQFQSLGWGWVGVAYRDANLLFRRDGATHCRWTLTEVAYSPHALTTADQDAINNGRDNENTLIDLRRLCDGAAAANLTALGGVIA